MKVTICPRCGQAFSTTAAGLDLPNEHAMSASEADNAVDEAVTEERVEPKPRDLPRCH